MVVGELEKLKNIRTRLSETCVTLILENSEARYGEVNGRLEFVSFEVSTQQCIKFPTHVNMHTNVTQLLRCIVLKYEKEKTQKSIEMDTVTLEGVII